MHRHWHQNRRNSRKILPNSNLIFEVKDDDLYSKLGEGASQMLCAPLGDGQSVWPQEETQKRLRQTRLLLIIGARKKMHGSHTGPRGRETPSARRQEWQEERA